MKYFYSFFLLLVVFACNNNDDDNIEGCYPDVYISNYQKNKQIDVMESNPLQYAINDGDQLVFTYTHENPQCENIADDESGEELYFELSPTVEEFTFTDEDLEMAKVIYRQTGAWVNTRANTINSGTLSGEKLRDDRYEVIADLTIVLETNEVISLQFERVFVLQE